MSERKIPVTSYLSKTDIEKLEDLAKERGSISSLIREAVKKFLEGEEA